MRGMTANFRKDAEIGRIINGFFRVCALGSKTDSTPSRVILNIETLSGSGAKTSKLRRRLQSLVYALLITTAADGYLTKLG
jgi:hypothetical protein